VHYSFAQFVTDKFKQRNYTRVIVGINVLQHLEESATLLIVNAVPIYDNNVWGASIQKGVAKRKKEARPRTNLGLVSLF